MSVKTPESKAYAREKDVALAAVQCASHLTLSVFQRLVKNEKELKSDGSPVTIADYAAQALMTTLLHESFPADHIVGEEDSTSLRCDESQDSMLDRIVSLTNEFLPHSSESLSVEEVLFAIDKGSHSGGPSGRFWTIDPVDGTKGFMRGEQYAVCLSLIEDGVVQLGVIGSPNYNGGRIFSAVREQGAEEHTLSLDAHHPLHMGSETPQIRFLESVEAAHASHFLNDQVSDYLNHHGANVGSPIRMDSQTKYCALARGDGTAYLRLPVPGKGYVEKIWDHAPGSIIVAEAGGIVSDSCGQPLDFGLGRSLGALDRSTGALRNLGVVGASREVHRKVLDALRKVAQTQSKA